MNGNQVGPAFRFLIYRPEIGGGWPGRSTLMTRRGAHRSSDSFNIENGTTKL